ncbi:MAG: hypothetical protein WCG12_03450 [Alcaligenaceae bacterium]
MNLRPASSKNQGQAAVEALLIIVFGFTLVLCIHHIGKLRSGTLDLLGESHFLSFIPTGVVSNLVVPNSGDLNASVALNNRYATVGLASSTYSAQQRELEQQLGFDSATLLRASAHSATTLRSKLPALGLTEQAPLVRHSFLLAGAGQAGSTQAAQAQIAGSAALWQDSFASSKQLVNASAQALQSVDQAWGRARLNVDWLLPWADEVLAPGLLGRTSLLQPVKKVSQSLNHLSK